MTASAPPTGAAFLLSTLLPQAGDRRAAASVAGVALLLFCGAVPFAKWQLPAVWGFIPVYQSVLVVNDLITSLLLFGQYRVVGTTGLLLLACGYLFTGGTAAVHMATFPGLFAPAGLLGAGPQSTAWLYMFWHAAFPLFVIAFAWAGEQPRPVTTRQRSMACAALGTIALVALGAVVATAGQSVLPPIMVGNRYTGLMVAVVGTVWALSALALVLLWQRRDRSVLHLWLTVVMLVWLLDIALSALLNGGRFDLGFYAGRLCGLLANSVVLVMLMLENASIHARLLNATHELRSANHELEAFAHAVSHDLRAPLRAMDGFSAALLHDHGAQLPDEARGDLQEIQAASRRMGGMVDGLLTLSRSTRGALQRGRIDLTALVHRLQAELARQEPHRQVQWNVAPAMSVEGDERMVEAVMRNLVNNAWKYTGRTPQATIRVWMEGPVESRCVCVADNGAGFEMARVGELFRPFHRLHHAEDFPGNGIGLATVQRIVQRHGGGIGVVASPGEGATFRFRLHGGPWTAAAAAAV
jgi:signal transduction histidine kinase